MFAGSFEKLRQKMKNSRLLNDNRFRYAAVFAVLALVILFGVVQANGPMKPHYPPQDDMYMGMEGKCCMGGKWGGMWGWWPMQPVPTITILEVAKDTSVTFSTSNLPEDKDFQVLMGPIYTRGVDGVPVGSFNSSDGSDDSRIYSIPTELQGDYRIAIRIQTDDDKPHYAFNWFYNNDTNEASTTVSEVDEDVAEVPLSMEIAAVGEIDQTLLAEAYEEMFEPFAFEICAVEHNDTVTIYTDNFPIDEPFLVQMGVMPEYPEAEPYYDGKMKKPMGPGKPNMGNDQPMGQNGSGMGSQQPMGQNGPGMGSEQPMGQSGPGMGSEQPMGQNGPGMGSEQPMGQNGPGMGSEQPMGQSGPGMGSEQPMGPSQPGMGSEMGQPEYDKPGYQMPAMPPSKQMPKKPPMQWIPYYDAGSFVLEEGDDYLTFDIPSALNGAYRISILVRTEHAYPYYAYNWFYNNDAVVCDP